MALLQNVVGFSEEQRSQFLQLAGEFIVANLATDMVGQFSDADQTDLASALKQGKDTNETVNAWIQRRFGNDPVAMKAFVTSIQNSLDTLSNELVKGLNTAQIQQLHTLTA